MDATARLWDVETGRQVQVFRGHDRDIWSAEFSPDGKFIVTGSWDNTARVWDVATGKEVQRFSGHEELIYTVAFSPDGSKILTGSLDDTARLWDVETGEEIRRFEGHWKAVWAVKFSPDGRTVLTGSLDNTARLWDTATGRELKVYKPHGDSVYTGAFSPDGKSVILAGRNETARLRPVPESRWPDPARMEAIAAAYEETGPKGQLMAFEGHEDGVRSVAVSPDGETILTGSEDDPARLWDIETGREVHRFEGHESSVYAVAFSPDGDTVLTGSLDDTARLWNAEEGREIRRFEGHHSSVYAVAFSPDGETALTGGWDNTARLWDIETGREVHRFEGHESSVYAVDFSPDGDTVLTGSLDETARLWDTDTGREIRRFEGHESSVRSVAFSPDGETILTGSYDDTARLWDAATGREIRRLEGHKDGVLSVAFTPEGKAVVTGSFDDTARLWRVPEARWPDEDRLAEIADHLAAEARAEREKRLDGLEADLNYALARAAASEQDFERIAEEIDAVRAETTSEVSEKLASQIDTALALANTIRADKAEAETIRRRLEAVRAGQEPQVEAVVPATVTGLDDLEQSSGPVGGERCHLGLGPFETTEEAREHYDALVPRLQAVAGIALTDQEHYAILAGGVAKRDFEATRAAYVALGLIPEETECVRGDRYAEFLNRDDIAADPLAGVAGAHALGTGGGGYSTSSFSPDGALLLGVDNDGDVRVWDVATGGVVATPAPNPTDAVATAAAFRDTGSGFLNLLVGYDDGRIRVFGRRGAQFAMLEPLSDAIVALRLSPNQRYILGVTAASEIGVWDMKSAAGRRRLSGEGKVADARFSPAGDAVLVLREVAGAGAGRMQLWPVAGGAAIWDHAQDSLLTTARFAPDGQAILAGGPETPARKFDSATGNELETFQSFDLGVPQSFASEMVAYSPNGETVTTAGARGGPRVLDAKTGTQRLVRSERQPVIGLRYTRSGDSIITTREGGTAMINDLDSRESAPLLANDPVLADREVRAVRFSPDGDKLVAKTADGALHIRRMPDRMARQPKPDVTPEPSIDPTLTPTTSQPVAASAALRDDAFAIVIGNRNYEDETPDVEFAHNDADQVGRLSRETLGIPGNRVQVQKDLSLSDFYSLFGSAAHPKGVLHGNIPEGTKEVIVYYSGHGVPGLARGEAGSPPGAFLLPKDGSPERPEQTAYSLNTLLTNLQTLPVDRVTVLLEACFSGMTEAGTLVPRTSGTFGVAAAAPQRPAKVSVLSATAFREAQLAHWDDDAEHGAFTWQLIKGLRGEADANGDNRIMLGELHSFVETGLKLDNWEERGRTQTPSLQTADPDHVLADFTEAAAE
jgi:WD40 repeat protein